MVKYKISDPPRIAWLKIHTLLFVSAVLVLWFSTLATILYPGNAQVSFDVFKPMIIEQGQFMMFWAVVLLLHFIAQTIWTSAQRREHDALVGRRSTERRLRDITKAKRGDAFPYDYDAAEDKITLSELL